MRTKIIFTLFFIGCSLQASLQEPLSIGKPAPIFTAQTIYGDTLSLQSLKGDIILVDFWTSWNALSRKHNLSTRKIYEKYRALSLRKKRKFVVVQVSLDTRPDLLSVAISKDNLYWRTHICDYKGWNSPYATLFNLNKLPTNFLIDTAGNIVSQNIWDDALDIELKELMK